MISGVQQHQVYNKFKELLTLTAPLSEPERLLLIGFGYEMSAADGDIDSREKKYLEAVAKQGYFILSVGGCMVCWNAQN